MSCYRKYISMKMSLHRDVIVTLFTPAYLLFLSFFKEQKVNQAQDNAELKWKYILKEQAFFRPITSI